MQAPPVRRVLVIGAGGHARVCIDALLGADETTVVGAVSADGAGPGDLGVPVIGRSDDWESLTLSRLVTALCVAIGDNRLRQDLCLKVTESGRVVTSVRASSAVVSERAALDDGVQVLPGAVINAAAVVGVGSIVNTNASVDHDCVIGRFAHVAPGATLGGGVAVGDLTLIGIGAVVLPGVRVGSGAVVGGGAVVVDDVADGAVVAGNPARVLGP